MQQLTEHFLLIVFVVITVGFLLGWLFPVEGPIDYIYDNYKIKKCATKLCPPSINVDELSEDELDFIRESIELVIGGESTER